MLRDPVLRDSAADGTAFGSGISGLPPASAKQLSQRDETVSAAPRYHPLCPPGEPFASRVSPAFGLPGKNRKKGIRSKPHPFGPLVFGLAGSTQPPPRRGPGANPGRRRPFFRPLRGDLVHGARSRARTVPGSLSAAFRGSCPLQSSPIVSRPLCLPPLASGRSGLRFPARLRRLVLGARIPLSFGSVDGPGTRARCCCVSTFRGLSRAADAPAHRLFPRFLQTPLGRREGASRRAEAAGILLTPNGFAGEASEPYSPLSVRIYDPRNRT